jgi:HEAT repeat protein
MSIDMGNFLKKFNMKKIHKTINIALIFMLIGMFLCAKTICAYGNPCLRVPLDRERLERELNKTKVSTVNRLISQAFLDLNSSDKEKIIEAMGFLSDLYIAESADIIRPFLSHNDEDIKNMAVASLLVLDDKEMIENFLSRLEAGTFKNIQEFKLMAELLINKKYNAGVKYLLEAYKSKEISYEVKSIIYSILRDRRLKSEAVPLFKDFMEKVGYDNSMSVSLFIILAESARSEAKQLLLEIVPKLTNDKAIAIAHNALKHIDYLQTKKRSQLFDFGRCMSSDYFKAEELNKILDGWLVMTDSAQKLQTAILLGRKNQRDVVPYLNAYFKSGRKLYRQDVKLTLLALSDERSVYVFSDIAFNVSGDEEMIDRYYAIQALKEIGTPEVITMLERLSGDGTMDIRESAQRAIYSIYAKKADIPRIDINNIKNDLPVAVWIPVKISVGNAAEDNDLEKKIQELVDNKVLIPWSDMVKKETFWKESFDSINLSSQDVYFTPLKDPSSIFVQDEKIYPVHTGRSITINCRNGSYSIKNAGASVPFVKGALSLAYHDDKGVWFYGGRLMESGLTGEMTKALSIEKIIDEAFKDPVLTIARELYGVNKDLFLTPMVQVEPLFMPVGIQKDFGDKDKQELGPVYFKKGNLAFVPIKEGLRLADVPLEKFPNSKLVVYIYKNSTALDVRFASLLGKEFNDKEWKGVFSLYGYEVRSDENDISFYKDDKEVEDREVFNSVLQGTAARFACFIIVLQDYLKFSGDRINGDTFTHQNINPFVIFDYDTFSPEGYKDENIRHMILSALRRLHDLADYFELSGDDKRQADRVFREILTREILEKKSIKGIDIKFNRDAYFNI